jgi:hypothetical protein
VLLPLVSSFFAGLFVIGRSFRCVTFRFAQCSLLLPFPLLVLGPCACRPLPFSSVSAVIWFKCHWISIIVRAVCSPGNHIGANSSFARPVVRRRRLTQDNVEVGLQCRVVSRGVIVTRQMPFMTTMPVAKYVVIPSLSDGRRSKMARKPAARAEFTLFDVVYEDGSQRSNRRVPSEILNSLDSEALTRASIEEQDRLIAEKSGTPAIAVKSIHRSGSKRADAKRSN